MATRCYMSFLFALVAATAFSATEYYAKDGITDWTVGSSFTLDAEGQQELPAGVKPVAGDTVCVPNGYTVTVNAEASREVVNGLARIRPLGTKSEIVIVVPEGETWTNACPVNYDGVRRGTYDHYGKLVKRGAGVLELVSPSTFVVDGYDVDYNTSVICETGTMYLPKKYNSKVFWCYLLEVGKGATVYLSANQQPYLRMIAGAGDFINTTASTIAITLPGSDVGGVAHETEFSGRLVGKIEINSAARIMLTGAESTFSGTVCTFNNGGKGTAWNGVTGIRKFGNKADAQSSIGTGSSVYVGNSSYNGGYLCLATAADGEQSTDKDFCFRAVANPCFIDAGAFGGVQFLGNWTRPTLSASAPSTFRNGQIVVCGSNTAHACALAGGIPVRTNGGTNYCFHLTKKGTGIWRLKDESASSPINKDRDGLSAVTVEEGVFQFDSLKRKYDFCAFGTGAQTMSAYTGLMDPAKRVDWQIALGAKGKCGILEYTGTEHVNAYSRPIVFKGDAGLRNSTEARVRYLALPPEGDFAKTLTLDGSNALDNEIADVTDTVSAPVSVVKNGSGKWVLGGNSTFHGDLTVNAGELVVRKYPTKYTWFKWVIKNNVTNGYSSAGNTVLQADHFCLYDANTVRQNAGLQVRYNSFADLQPGEACYETERKFNDSNGSRPLAYLFNDNSGTYGMYLDGPKNNLGNNQLPKIDKPETWWPIVMRLADGSSEVVAWDYTLYFGGAGSSGCRGVGISTVEGSVDGIHWDNLIGGDMALKDLAKDQYCWASAGSANRYCSWGCAQGHTHTSSKLALPIPDDWKFTKTQADAFSVLANVGTVRVAGGAKLTADGEGIQISTLKIDGSDGESGTVDGFTFAADGTLVADNVTFANGEAVLPIAFANADASENIGDWTLILNGKEVPKTRCRIVATDEGVKLVKSGLLLIVQ